MIPPESGPRDHGKPGHGSAAWDAGLIWGGFVLLLALGLLALLLPDIRAATRKVPTLSPATAETIELDDDRDLLVEVRGFKPDCDDAHFDGKRLLVPAWSPGYEALIYVALESSSECRALGSSFRGEARTQTWLGGDEMFEPGVTVVELRRFPGWALAVVLCVAGLGLLGIASALVERRRVAARFGAGLAPHTEPVPPSLSDPYRPGHSDRLIYEALRPSATHLAKLRRKTILRVLFGLVLLGSGLACAGVGGQRIREREQIWTHGVTATESEVDGESEPVGPGIVHTQLDVTYVDHLGRTHRERMTATSLGHAPNTSSAPIVRYHPDTPERFTVSWVHEQTRGSLILLGLGGASLLCGAFVILLSASRDRTRDRTTAVFEDPREALLDLVGVERHHAGADRDMVTHHFRVRDSDRNCTVVVGRGQPGPLFLDRRNTVALALYNPRERAGLLVLSEDLRELEQPPFSPAQLRGRYRAMTGSPEFQPNRKPRPRRRRPRRAK